MADNYVREDASAGEDEGFSPGEPANGVVIEGAADSADQMDPADAIKANAVGTFHSEPNDIKVAEEVAREDMFVDCPDEIEISESQQSSEEKDNLLDDQYNESDSGIKVQQLIAEIDRSRDMLDKSIAEKEKLALDYEEERSVLTRELAYLSNQLKILSEKQNTPGENADGVVTWDEQTMGSGSSLLEMISECSRYLKNALDERLQTDEKFRELHSVLHMKDQEIDFLKEKVAQLSESNNIENKNLSESYEAQLEKDQQIEEVVNRILDSLPSMNHQADLLDVSLTEKIFKFEKSVTLLVEKYNLFVSESDLLFGCLNEVGSDSDMIADVGTFVLARDKILEFRRNEESLNQKLSNLEDENRKLVEQVENQRSTLENVSAEIGRLSAQVEQEKNRYANTKEKLSMAVTKGKGLVQQRDSLKQLLAEKTSQLEKISVELQEKSSALDAAEKTKELLAESEQFSANLQESLAEKYELVRKCGEILSDSVAITDVQSADFTEKLRWLADENRALKALSLQYNKLTDALLVFDFPETVASSELDVRIRWLAESFFLSKEAAAQLQSEIAETKEAANGEIDHLTTSLLAEMQEKSYLQAEVEDLRNKYEAYERLQHELVEARETVNNEIDHLKTSLLAESHEKNYLQLELENLRDKYEGVIQKECLVSSQRDNIVTLLLEASGLANDSQEVVLPENSDMTAIVDTCLAKIKENMHHTEPSQVDKEIFESFRSLLYIKDQEMSLYKLIIEEDMAERAQFSNLSDELEMKTGELNALKDEKAVIQKSLEQLEDRCALLKDKLSMAVKKGKGLVQERENLKGSLNEKNVEIDRLESELQQTLSRYTENQNQITKLSLDVERISLLETDLVATKKHADQLEQFLAESNNMLNRVMESIEGIITPTDLFFEEPTEKVKWLAGYLSEQEISRMEVKEDLEKVKGEASSLASKLSEVQKKMQSLEDALSIAENSRAQLLDEKKELEVSKALLEEEFQKEKEKVSSNASKYEELSSSKRALEDALLRAEDNILMFMNERDIAVESRALAEEQLHKLKEDVSGHMTKLADADKTIQSLEDSLSQAQKNISLLAEENSKVQVGSADLDSEINKIKEEAHSHASRLAEASLTIKSLEDALLNAENNMADVVEEKKIAEQEIVALTSKLETCTEELAGTRGSIENRHVELSSQLNHLQLVLKDETLSSLLGQCFKRKFESLNDINVLLKETGDCFLEMDLNLLQDNPITEDDSSLQITLPSGADIDLNMELLDDTVNAVDSESIMFHIGKMNEKFHLKDKMLTDKFGNLSTLMDGSIAALLRRLHLTKDRIISIIKYTKSLRQQVEDIKTDKQRQEDTIASLESDIRILLSACTDATQQLELNVHSNLPELRSIQDYVKKDGRISMDLRTGGEDAAAEHATNHLKMAEKLLVATRENQDLIELFQDAVNKFTNITEDMQNKMKETQLSYHEVLEERDLYKDKILKLETDLEAQKNLYHDVTVKLDDYKETEGELRKRESELSASLSKVHELEQSLLSAFQVQSISDKMNEVEVPDAVLAVGDSHDSVDVRKLFYIIDSFNGFRQRVSSLCLENEELQSTIDNQILEIEFVKKQLEDLRDNEKDSEKINKLLELESGLQNMVRKLGGSDSMDDPKEDNSIWLLPLLDKLVMAKILESENLKSKNEELNSAIDNQILEIEFLKKQLEDLTDNEKDSEKINKLLELEPGLQNIVRKLGGSDSMDDPKEDNSIWLLPLLDKLVMAKILESENLKSKNEELSSKLFGAQKVVDDLSNKVKYLEDSNQARIVPPELDHGRGTSVNSLSTQSEISEVQEMAALGMSSSVPQVPSAAHVRTLRKGSSDHLAINVDSDSERLINNKESDEDKGHIFKSLNTTGLIPRQGRAAADRIDGVWVSGSRALMNHPRGRLGLIAYWLVLHLWLIGTIL